MIFTISFVPIQIIAVVSAVSFIAYCFWYKRVHLVKKKVETK